MGIKNASLQEDGFFREVSLRNPEEWDPKGTYHIWNLHVPPYGLDDAPGALRQTLQRYLFARHGLKFKVSLFHPCLYFVFRGSGPKRAPLPRTLMMFSVVGNRTSCCRRVNICGTALGI